jgi:DNA-binding response OmpR family regulator
LHAQRIGVMLAVSSDEARAPAAASRERAVRLLLVEDDADSAEAVTLFLKWEGHDVQWVSTGHDALERLVADGNGPRPDVVLLDLTLPDMSGVAIMEELHRRDGMIPPVILLSARTDTQLATAAQAVGAVQVVRKPFELSELTNAIRSALEAPARAEQQGKEP